MPFRILDHTADLGIEATGGSPEEALEQAALALTCVLTGRAHPHLLGRPDRETRFFVEAPDREALAVAFLSELLWQAESQDLLWVGGGVRIGPGAGGTVRADAAGNAVVHDPARHGQGVEVKAVTYHSLLFKPVGGSAGKAGKGWLLRVILDI